MSTTVKDHVIASVQPGAGLELLPGAGLLAVVGVGLACAVVPAVWARTGFVVTVAHEGAHALAAITARRRVTGVRVERDMSGSTISVGRPTGLGAIWTAWWGYPGPAALAALMLFAIGHGYALAAALVLAALSSVLLVLSRSLTTLAVTAPVVALAWGAWWVGGVAVVAVPAGASVLLVLGAARSLFSLAMIHVPGHRDVGHSDAHSLFALTMIPSPVWMLTFVLAVGAAAAYCTATLLTALVG